MADAPADREQLAAMLEGRSDDEINAFFAEQGAEAAIKQIFDGMQAAFNADRAAGQEAVVQWDVDTTDGTISYQLEVKDGTCTTHTGTPLPARLTLGMSLPNFLRFLSGKLDGMQAFMSGQLKVGGDMMLAQSMQAWFGA